MGKEAFCHHLRKCLKRYKRQKSINGHTKEYFADKINILRQAAKQWDVPFLSLFINFLFTLIIYGESSQYYVMEEMYKYNRLEKKKRMTVLKAFKLDFKYNRNASDGEKDILLDKHKFNSFYKQFIKREWIYPKEAKIDDLKAFIKKHGKVFCKPNYGTQGENVFILSYEEINDDIIKTLVEKEYIVEEIIKQNKKMADLHAKSLNTLRIFTIIDRNGEVHIAQPLLRVGLNDSIIDNVSGGGMFYLVDAKEGIIYSRGRTEVDRTKHIYQPGTNIVMLGFKIPMYNKICDMVIKASKMIPNLRYVGWDVAISESGPELIEGNIEYGATLHGNDGMYKEIKQYL